MKSKNSFRLCLATIGLMFCLGAQPALASVNIIVQPGSQVALAGSNPVITSDVTVTAGEVITGYSWQMSTNGLNPFTTVGSSANLTLTNVQPGATGLYPSGSAICSAPPRSPILSPSLTARPLAHCGFKPVRPLGNSKTTVEPSRKRPISCPCLRMVLCSS